MRLLYGEACRQDERGARWGLRAALQAWRAGLREAAQAEARPALCVNSVSESPVPGPVDIGNVSGGPQSFPQTCPTAAARGGYAHSALPVFSVQKPGSVPDSSLRPHIQCQKTLTGCAFKTLHMYA